MRISLKSLILLMATLLLVACGFHLRGQVAMPFETLYLKAGNLNTPLINELRRNFQSNRVTLMNSADQTEVVLHIVSETPSKQILSLGGDGRVNEFRLFYRVSLLAYDRELRDWIPAEEISLFRDYSYDDTRVLAKDAEESLLYKSMRTDMAQQILRRLSHAKPRAK